MGNKIKLSRKIEVEVDLSEIPDDIFAQELQLRRSIVDEIVEDHRHAIEESVTLIRFSTDEIAKELLVRQMDASAHSIARIYRAVAEGRNSDALEELFEMFPREMIAPPSTELAVADLLSGRKGSSHVRN